MKSSELLMMYITILIGILTTATIVVTLLKEEMLGKSFREVIKSIELKKGDTKLKKLMTVGIINLCIYVIVLAVSIFWGEKSLEWVLLLLIIHLGILTYRIFKYFLDVYNKILDVNIGSTKWRDNDEDEAWKEVVLDFIIDSKDPNHYDVIKKHVEKQEFKKYLIGFFVEKDNAENKKLLNYISHSTYRLKFLLRNNESILDIVEEVKRTNNLLKGISEKTSEKMTKGIINAKKEFLENIIQYPEFIKYSEMNSELMSLIDNGDISSYFMGYCEIVGDNELIETYKNTNGENFSDLPKDNDMYQAGREIGSIYLSCVNKEPKQETYITRWIENIFHGENLELEELNIKLEYFDQLQKDEVKKGLVAHEINNKNLRSTYPNIYNLLYNTAVLIEQIVYYFAKEKESAKKSLNSAKKDKRIIEMDKDKGGNFNYIWVTKTTPFQGIRFLIENPDAKNKKITNYDHVYFAADKEGNIIGSEGITHFGGNENNEYPKKGRINGRDFQNKYKPKKLSAEEILGDEDLKTDFMETINEILSDDTWKNNCDNKQHLHTNSACV